MLFRSGSDVPGHSAAAARLAAAVKDVPTGTAWTHPYVTLNEVQATFEQAIQTLQTDGAFETAVSTADVYAKVAAAGRDREKRAEVLAAWAEAVQKQGGDFQSRFTTAANEFVSLATKPDLPATVRVDRLHRAAKLFLSAGDRPAHRETLAQLVKMPDLPEIGRAHV